MASIITMVDNRFDMIMIDLEITLYVHHIMYMYAASICIPKTIIMLSVHFLHFMVVGSQFYIFLHPLLVVGCYLLRVSC